RRHDLLRGRCRNAHGDDRGHGGGHERGDDVAGVRPLLHDQAGRDRAWHVDRALGRAPPRRRARRPELARARHARAGAAAGGGAVKTNSSAVLVVDDETTIADGLRLTLESEGYTVRTAGGVRDALAAFGQYEPHAAIVDLMLPDGDGLNLTRELRRRDPSIQVNVITAYGSVRKAMEATKGAGAFHVLEKPFDPDELLGLMRSALLHRRHQRQNRPSRGGGRGLAPPRRDHGDAAGAPGEAPPRARGARGAPGRRRQGRPGGFPPHLVDQPEPRGRPA